MQIGFRSRMLRIVTLSVIATGIGCAAGAMAAIPPGGHLRFAVFRDGSKIGEHELTFHDEGGNTQVDINTKVAVKIAFVTAYRFEHEGHEVWHGDRLIRLWSKTNDDGTKHVLDAETDASGLEIHADGHDGSAPNSIVPASLWNDRILQGGTILNTLDGTRMAVRVADLGPDPVFVGGRKEMASHYAITGDLQREVWYDSAHVLVKIRFKGKDGSTIEYMPD
jgi:hypothetical protein